jgi:hypothetical protein
LRRCRASRPSETVCCVLAPFTVRLLCRCVCAGQNCTEKHWRTDQYKRLLEHSVSSHCLLCASNNHDTQVFPTWLCPMQHSVHCSLSSLVQKCPAKSDLALANCVRCGQAGHVVRCWVFSVTPCAGVVTTFLCSGVALLKYPPVFPTAHFATARTQQTCVTVCFSSGIFAIP